MSSADTSGQAASVDPSTMLRQAAQMHERGDHETAERLWAIIRTAHPLQAEAYSRAGVAVMQRGAHAEAEAILTLGRTNIPADLGIAIEHAWAAHRLRDWNMAEQRWADLRRQFPTQPAGYTYGAVTFREAGRLDAAETLLLDAQARFPDDGPVFVEHAWIVHRRQDWSRAGALWAAIRDRFPRRSDGWTGAMISLIESGQVDTAEAMCVRARQEMPDDGAVLGIWADLAMRRRDWNEAARRWAVFRDRFDRDSRGWRDGARALLEAGDPTAADLLLDDARGRFPDDAGLLATWAELAGRRRDWAEAAARWEVFRDRFPYEMRGALEGARMLNESGDRAAAEALLEAAVTRFPGEPGPVFLLAELAMRARDWTLAAQRWATVRSGFPREARGFAEGGIALMEAGAFDEAEALLGEAAGRLADDRGVAVRYAEIAARQHRWSEAIVRWAEVETRFPNVPDGSVGRARALMALDRKEEAQAAMEAALQRWPADVGLVFAGADIAIQRGDIARAVRLFEAAVADHPDNLDLRRRWIEAMMTIDQRTAAAAALDEALLRWRGHPELSRSRINLALRQQDYGSAYRALQEVDAVADNRPLALELALLIMRGLPPPEVAEPVMALLATETDTGARDWAPTIASAFPFFLVEGTEQRALMARFLADGRHGLVDTTTRLVWQALVGVPLDDAALRHICDHWLPTGRMTLLSTVFSDAAIATHATQRDAARRLCDMIGDRLTRPSWPSIADVLDLVTCLMVSTVFSRPLYRRLLQAARGLPEAAFTTEAPGEAHAVLAGILARTPVLTQEEEAYLDVAEAPPHPAVISRRGERLRIAAIVSGQLRGFEQGRASWRHLGLEGHDVTTFVATWRQTGRNWGRAWAYLRPYPALWSLVANSNGLSFLVQNFPRLGAALSEVVQAAAETDRPTLQNFYDTEHVQVDDDRVGRFVGWPNARKMHFKIEEAQRMAGGAGAEFDLYLRLRPDYGFGAGTSIDWHRAAWQSARENGLFVDIPYVFTAPPGLFKIADAFAVGVREPMDAFAQTYSWQEAVARSGRRVMDSPLDLVPHASPAYACFIHGVIARTLPGLRFEGFLEAPILPVARILELLREDIGGAPGNDLQADFLAGCEAAVAAAVPAVQAEPQPIVTPVSASTPSLLEPSTARLVVPEPVLTLEASLQYAAQGDTAAIAALPALLPLSAPDRIDPWRTAVSILLQHDPILAEDLLTRTIERFPHDLALALDHARIAHGRRDWHAASARWTVLRDRFPDRSVGYVLGAISARDAGDPDTAERLLADARERFPDGVAVWVEWAMLAQLLGSWPEAIRRWGLCRERFPDAPQAIIGEARALLELGRADSADALLSDALIRTPDNGDLAVAWAEVPMRCGDHSGEAARWAELRSRSPRNPRFWAEGVRALKAAGRADAAEALAAEARGRFPGEARFEGP